MGNCLRLQTKVVKIMKMDGEILKYKPSIKVNQILSEFRGYAVSDMFPVLRRLVSQKKLHLILDLDHTLVQYAPVHPEDRGFYLQIPELKGPLEYSYDDDFGGLYPVFDWNGKIKLRPGIRTFLNQASQLFELSIYTMASRKYAKVVASILDPTRVLFGRRIYTKTDCTTKKQKGLDVIRLHPRVVLIVDDNVDVWAESDRSNVVTLPPYDYFHKYYELGEGHSDDEDYVVNDDFDLEDKELARVMDVLREVHSTFFDGSSDYMTKDVVHVLETLRAPMIRTSSTDQPDDECNATKDNTNKRDRDHDIDKLGCDAKRPRVDSQEQCQIT